MPNWEAIGAVGELIGGVAVIATLLYLASQIRQNTKIARAQSQRELLHTYPHHQAMLTHPDHIDVIRRGYKDFHGLSKDEQARFHHLFLPLFNQVEAVFRMHRQGLVEASSYAGYREMMLSVLATSGGRQWWEIGRLALGADFVAEFENALSNEPNIVPVTERVPFYRADE